MVSRYSQDVRYTYRALCGGYKSDRSSSEGNCLRGELFSATKDHVNRVPNLDSRIMQDSIIAGRVCDSRQTELLMAPIG